MNYLVWAMLLLSLTLWTSCRPRTKNLGSQLQSLTSSPVLDLTEFGNPLLKIAGNKSWTKFIVEKESGRVHFMNANVYEFHYQFAVAEIPLFSGFTPPHFDQRTLYNHGRIAYSGGVIVAGGVVALDLVANNVFQTNDAISVLEKVRAQIKVRKGMNFGYMPTVTQREDVEQNKLAYENAGFPLVSPIDHAEWLEVYSPGWAAGRVVRVPDPREINDWYLDGRLKANDILLTPGVPAEVPAVAGIISEVPVVPNSHVVILAQSFGVPFFFTKDKNKILLARQAAETGGSVFINSDEYNLSFSQIARLSQKTLRRIDQIRYKPIKIRPTERYPKWYERLSRLNHTETQFFGGKASNFRILLDAIPQNMPREAFAFSFNMFHSFMDRASLTPIPHQASQSTPSQAVLDLLHAKKIGPPKHVGNAVRTLLPNASMPVAQQALHLEAIRELIVEYSLSPPGLRKKVEEAFTRMNFDFKQKVRFRSSTNIEDGDVFSGAGLYDSKSGCLADDFYPPQKKSYCGGKKKKSALRAMRKVFASLYNQNAFLERQRHGVKESEVGMAILSHYSFPDEYELANGVITLEVEKWSPDLAIVNLVSQLYADSITNPESGLVAEHIEAEVDLTENGRGGIGGGYDDLFGPIVDSHPGGTIIPMDRLIPLQEIVPGDLQFENLTPRTVNVDGQPFLDVIDIGIEQPGAVDLRIKQYSNHPEIRRGQLVMQTRENYAKLLDLSAAVARKFAKAHGLTVNYTLDMEYKLFKTTEGPKLIIKQVRIVPKPKRTTDNPLILGGGYELCTSMAGDFSGVWPAIAENLLFHGDGRVNFATGFFSEIGSDLIGGIEVRLLDSNGAEVALSQPQQRLQIHDQAVDASLKVIGIRKFRDVPEVLPAPSLRFGTLGSDATFIRGEFSGPLTKFKNLFRDRPASTLYFACSANPPDPKPESLKNVSFEPSPGIKVNLVFRYSSQLVGKGEKQLAELRTFEIAGLADLPPLNFADNAVYGAGHHNIYEGFLVDIENAKISSSHKAKLRDLGYRYFFVEPPTRVEEISGVLAAIGEEGEIHYLSKQKPMEEFPWVSQERL